MVQKKKVLSIAGLDPLNLFGDREKNLLIIDAKYPGVAVVRGEKIILKGKEKDVNELTSFFDELARLAANDKIITEGDIENLLGSDRYRPMGKIDDSDEKAIFITSRGMPIKPRSGNQRKYAKAIAEYDVVIAVGPAGTGKTFLAVASAAAALKKKTIDRIIMVRPVVEAGESLGFLPGDFQAKLDPYVRPIVDALYDLIGREKTIKYQENGTIEIAPLAYMRGRTLNNAYVILDEAQNTTPMQMKMFLTRLGVNAKAVVNGDLTQIDLDPPSNSGLIAAKKILADVSGIAFIDFGAEDVVRHRLVRGIIDAFERNGGQAKE